MPAALLQSQIDSLEIGSSETDILEADASLAPATIVLNIQAQLPI
jgi:gluconate kinase